MSIIGNPIIAAVKTEVDDQFSATSSNPVQNRVITQYITEPSLTLEQDEETKLVYVATQDGIRLGDGILVEGGGGGGGGGGSSSYTPKVKNLLDTRTITVAKGGSAVIAFRYTSVNEDGDDDGIGTGVITVGGVQKQTMNVSQGEHTIDISPILSAGTNNVILKVINSEGRDSKLQYTIIVVELTLTTTFNEMANYSGGVTFNYTLTGVGDKTMHFKMDGNDLGTEVISSTNRSQYYAIPEQPYGGHVFECYAEMDVEGMTLTSNVIRLGMIWVEEGVRQAAIVSTFNQSDVIQGEILSIPYLAYDPLQANATVVLSVLDSDGNQYSSSTVSVDRTPQIWTLDDYPDGDITIRLRCGVASTSFDVHVTPYVLPVSPVTDGLVLEFSAAGRSNGEVNPEHWNYGSVEASFENFGWRNSDGWLADENGATVLRFLPGDSMTIPFYPFVNNIISSGYTIEVEMATHNVRDYESVVLSCIEGGRGFLIQSQEASLHAEQTGVSVLFKEDSRIRVAFSVENVNMNRLIYTYINGIMCGVAQYASIGENFRQTNPVGITIGSNSCGLDLYKIRLYNKGLTKAEQLDNFIVDRSTLAQRQDAYNRNDILDEREEVTIDSLPDTLSHFLIKCPQLPQTKEEDDKTVEIEFIDPAHPDRSWTATGVKLGIQGTSSAVYPLKNYKFKLKNGITYINRDSNGNVRTDVGFPIHEGEMPTKTICYKADYASSENANNVVLAMFYNDMCPYKTPPQQENSHIRQGIDGFSTTLFWQDTTDDSVHFLGKGNCNVDKGNDDIFGFTDEYPHAQSWEFLNNTSDRCLFKSDDFTSMGVDKKGNVIKAWQNDFEARYPDDSLDIDDFAECVEWVVSTDRDAVNTQIEKDARLNKFKTEFEDHFIKEAMLFYYVFTSTFLIMDNRAKNMFMTSFDGQHWFSLPYDFDSCLGINNEGALVFEYNLEDTDTVGGVEVYTGQKSVLWNNFRDAFGDEIAAMYVRLRSINDDDPSHESPFSYFRVAKLFTDHQKVWPEALWNEDAFVKYIQPYLVDGEDYLSRCQGSKASQRDWWLYNGFRYWDSKYHCGDATANRIIMRTNRIADITIIPYAHIYGYVLFGSYPTIKRCTRNVSCLMECNADNLDDTETYIYSADQLSSIGDLSPLMVGEFNSANATKLQSIKLGDEDENYDNPQLGFKYSVNVGRNDLLESINVANCSNFGAGDQKSLDLSGCLNLRTVIATGTQLRGITLPNGGHVQTIKLPASTANFTIRNQPEVETLVFEGHGNITTLVVENTPNIPLETIIVNNPIANVRLMNFDVTVSSAENLQIIYNKLAASLGVEADMQTETAPGNAVSGIFSVSETVPASLIAAFGETFPEVLIVSDGQATCVVRFRDWDGTVLDTQNIARGGTAVDPVATGLIETPVRPDSARIRYTFDGWDRSLSNIQTHTVITASYSEESAWYAIFVNWDGTELYRELVLTGESVNDPVGTKISAPVRPADGDYSYTYTGWDRSLLNFHSDRIITARYATSASLTVTFVNWDGTELYTTHCKGGGSVEDPVASGAIPTPTRPDDDQAQIQYTYIGWNRDLSNINESITATATYSRISYYKATFLNWDGSTLYIERLRYRAPVEDPVIAGYIETPERESEESYGYIYKGWNAAMTPAITANVNYTAQYKTDREFIVTFVNDDNSPLNTQYVFDEDDAIDPVANGIIAIPTKLATDQYQYEYNGWNTSLTNVKSDRTIKAVYTSTVRKYSVRFLNDDGTVIRDDGQVNYGTRLTKPSTPTHSSGDPKYEFQFWDPDETTVTKDRDYIAIYRDNTIDLVRYLDGSLIEYEDDSGANITQYAFYQHPSIESVEANPSSVGAYSFNNCPELTTVDLTGTGALTIGTYAFTYDSKLKDLIIRSNSVATIPDPFSTLNNTAIVRGFGTLYVPNNLVASYRSAANWGGCVHRIFPIDDYPITDYETIKDSWSEIFAAEQNGTYATKYKIGDTKKCNVNGIETYFRIAGFNLDTPASGGGTAPITWVSMNAHPVTHRMDSFGTFPAFGWQEVNGIWEPKNVGIHSSSAMCTWVISVQSGGTLNVEYRCSSEGVDRFRLIINGTQIVNNGGTYGWSTHSVTCSAGDTVTVIGTYTKDSSIHTGEDRCYIRFSGDAAYTIDENQISEDTLPTYETSELRQWLNETLLQQIDNEVRSHIIPVRKKSYHTYKRQNLESTESVWVLSAYELGLSGSYEGSGARYNSLFPNAQSRAFYYANGGASYSWLRTITNGGYMYAHSAGSWNTTQSTNSFGNIYGFCT